MTSRARPKVVRSEYIETESKNKISRRAHILGTPNITLGGHTVIQADVHLRGDLHRLPPTSGPPTTGANSSADPSVSHTSSRPSKPLFVTHAISIGRFTIISTGSIVKPPSRISRNQITYFPVKIGDHVYVGPHCHISAVSISSHVYIGEKSVLMPFCIVKDRVKILPGSVIPPNMVIPPCSIVGGSPARILDEVAGGWGVMPGSTVTMSANSGITSSDSVTKGESEARALPGFGLTSNFPDGLWVEGGYLNELWREIR